MEKSIRVRILGRDYPLLVKEKDEALTRNMASYIDGKMQAFKKAHPDQSGSRDQPDGARDHEQRLGPRS